jgi:hypothetical protein
MVYEILREKIKTFFRSLIVSVRGELSYKQADVKFFGSEMVFICLEITVYYSDNRL